MIFALLLSTSFAQANPPIEEALHYWADQAGAGIAACQPKEAHFLSVKSGFPGVTVESGVQYILVPAPEGSTTARAPSAIKIGEQLERVPPFEGESPEEYGRRVRAEFPQFVNPVQVIWSDAGPGKIGRCTLKVGAGEHDNVADMVAFRSAAVGALERAARDPGVPERARKQLSTWLLAKAYELLEKVEQLQE